MNTNTNRNLQIYGCDISEFKESFEDSIIFKTAGPAMGIASLLSDAQEEMAMGLTDIARQTINRAKWALTTYIISK